MPGDRAKSHAWTSKYADPFMWNPIEWSNESRDWLNKPRNQKLFWEDPQNELADFLRGKDVLPGAVASSLDDIAQWFATVAVSNYMENPVETMSAILTFQHYKLTSVNLFINLNESDKRRRKQGKLAFNDGGLCLARLLTLGLGREAELLNERMLRGLHDRLFYGEKATTAAPFIFDLYAGFRGTSVSFEKMEVKRANVYDKLLPLWSTTNVEQLAPAILSACDFHVSRSQEHSDEESFEFCDYLDRIFPAEILMLMRLRESMGLEVPQLDHPLMSHPVAKLNPPASFPKDPLLESIREVMSQN